MRILVIVPTYNERQNLPVLVQAILAYEGFRVLVVDDSSPDGTGEVADDLRRQFPTRVDVLHRTGVRGLGRSYIDAIKLAVRGEDDFICQMDGDLSHDPKYLPDLMAAAVDGRYDLVIGSRYVNGVSVVNWPLRRLVLSTFANRYVRFVMRLPVNDCTSGFRCWTRQALFNIPLERMRSDGYAFLVEMLFEASQRNARIGEVPIIFVERRVGASKMSRGVILESVLMPWRLVLASLLRRAIYHATLYRHTALRRPGQR